MFVVVVVVDLPLQCSCENYMLCCTCACMLYMLSVASVMTSIWDTGGYRLPVRLQAPYERARWAASSRGPLIWLILGFWPDMALEMAGFGPAGTNIFLDIISSKYRSNFREGRRRFLFDSVRRLGGGAGEILAKTPYLGHFGPWTVFEQR